VESVESKPVGCINSNGSQNRAYGKTLC